jgi:Rod binding domain-containing protein
MSDLSAPAVSPSLLRPVSLAALPGRDATAEKVRKTAEDFEASFIAALLQPVFDALPTDGAFGGGQGEAAFRSFMVEAMAKQTARAGGVGLADTVQREMLRMQGAA